MSKIIITSTINSIRVDLGVYATMLERLKGVWNNRAVTFHLTNNFIIADIRGEKSWYISHDENDTDRPTLKIDSVDGVAPTDLADLFNLLQNLLT